MQNLLSMVYCLCFKRKRAFLFLVSCFFVSLNIYAQDSEKTSTVVNSDTLTKDAADNKAETAAESKTVEPPPSKQEAPAANKNMAPEPIIVNGDTVEFFTEKKEVIATGNVEVDYKGVKLTCQKLTINSQTKDGIAEGSPRLDDRQGVIEGSKIIYNFATKTGTIVDSEFRSNPYFGRAEESNKVSELEFVNRRGYFTSCSYDKPHYHIKSRRMNIFPGDKIQTRDDTFYVSRIPLFYLPQYNRSLKDPLMHVQFLPGKSKDWGPYLLSAWRYNLTEDITGRIYLDWRQNLGVAEGFGLNYTTSGYGKGDFKYYYSRERNRTKDFPPEDVTLTRKFQRYLIRWRHKWDIDEQTNLVSEYWKIVDSKKTLYPGHSPSYNLLKEYFFREYEKDAQPLSYVLVHHAFNYGGLDFLMQKRTNRWYDETEKLPEIKYSLPSYKIGETPFYFEDQSSAANYNHKHPVPSPSGDDIHSIRFDTTNKLSLPMKVAFVRLTPFVQHRGTYYKQDVYGAATVLRTIFYTGSDASTKFYRIFNVKSNFLRLDINGIRHVITPTIAYSYNNKPTIPSAKLVQIDGVDSISGRSNGASLQLSNILQTKRNNQTVNFLDFLISSSYTFKTKNSRGSNLGDILLKLDLLPYSWVRVTADATYNHSSIHTDPNYGTFTNVNYDLNFDLGRERSFGLSDRYQRKGPREFIANLKWRLSPKWKFSIYERFITGHHDPSVKRGLREQEYVLSRDLHCWTVELTYNIRKDRDESIWFVFRLKAFPELEFEFNQTYHQPKPGELSY